ITQSSARIRPDERVISSSALAWILRSPILRAQYDKMLLGTGVPRLNIAHVRALRVPLAPPPEQRRIIAKLEALLARSRRARGALDAVPALLERFRQSVLTAAFRGDLTRAWREKNRNVEPASKLLERSRAERRRRWEEAGLERLRARGKAPNDDGGKGKYQGPKHIEAEGLPELPHAWTWASVETMGSVDLGRMRSPEKHAGKNVCAYLRVKNVYENRIDVSDVMEMQFEPEEFEFYRLLP